ncbi:MAG: hypothetical protein K6F33_03425 [Bacteroidales bacterium]|nr:hypothetical protein [Bacteroidales bacterium]
MENIYAIIMFAMGGGLLLYALVAYLFGDTLFLFPKTYSIPTDKKGKKEYARKFAKLMGLIGLAFVVSGLVGLTEIYWLAVVVLIAGFVVAGKIGGKIMNNKE